MNTLSRIRQIEREMEECKTAAKAGGMYANEHRRRYARLRHQMVDLKFAGVHPRRNRLNPAEIEAAMQVDALVEHFPTKPKKIKFKKVVNFRARDFDAARRMDARKVQHKVEFRQRGMFRVGEVMKG